MLTLWKGEKRKSFSRGLTHGVRCYLHDVREPRPAGDQRPCNLAPLQQLQAAVQVLQQRTSTCADWGGLLHTQAGHRCDVSTVDDDR